MALKKIKTDSITDDAITAVKLHDDIYLSTGSFKVPSGTTAQRGTTATGAFRFNTTDTSFEGYDGSAWGAIGGAENAYTKETFTATANQTTFTLANAYTLGYIEVYLNGVKLISGDDFTATSTSAPYTVVLTTGVAVGNVVQTVAFNTFVVADTVPASGGSFTGAVTLPSPVINTGITGSAILDEDAMGSDSATKLATQQSIKAYVDAQTHGIAGLSSTGSSLTDTVTVAGNLAVSGATLTLAGATSNLSTFTEDLTVAANYSMAVIGPVTIPNVTVNGNLNIMTELNVTGDIDTGANGSFNIIG